MTPTLEQLKEIANKVRGTRNNVYRVAEQVLGYEIDDVIFDLLREHENLFKCEMCGEWLDLQHEALTDICGQCLDGDEDE